MWPARRSRSFIRVCADPRPIFRCSTSITWYSAPSISIVAPLRSSPVSIMQSSFRSLIHLFWGGRHHARLTVLHHTLILDPHAAPAGDVDAGLDRDHHTIDERILRHLSQPR